MSKIAIVGLGGMGRRHCQAVKLVEGAELKAICDLNEGLFAEVQKDYPNAKGYTDYKKMLAEEDLDLVVVATTGPFHYDVAIAAAQAKVKAILCEKPMTTSIRKAKEIIETCQANQVRLAVNHIRRWSSTYLKLKSLIKEGIIGDIRHFFFEFGGGQFASNGGHVLDTIRFLTDENPEKVFGFIDQTGTPSPRGPQYKDPGAYGMMWFSGGVKVFFNMSEDYGCSSYFEILGSVGRIIIDEKINRFEIWSRKLEDRDLPFTKRPTMEQVPFVGAGNDMIEISKNAMQELLGDGEISCTGLDGLMSLQMAIAVHYSHEQQNGIVDYSLPKDWEDKEFSFT